MSNEYEKSIDKIVIFANNLGKPRDPELWRQSLLTMMTGLVELMGQQAKTLNDIHEQLKTLTEKVG